MYSSFPEARTCTRIAHSSRGGPSHGPRLLQLARALENRYLRLVRRSLSADDDGAGKCSDCKKHTGQQKLDGYHGQTPYLFPNKYLSKL